MMKTIITLQLLIFLCIQGLAQEEITKELSEVEVTAAQVVQKVDGKLIYPTPEQKEHSTNGYNMLQKLTLTNIIVDDVSHTISAIDNRGAVQLRINGIEVSKTEMLLLDPQSISKIDFIDKPGIRYGEDIAYVINIITRRTDTGYTIGTDLTQAATTAYGDDMVYAKTNRGKGELIASYNFYYCDFKGERLEQTADYTLNDGSVYTINRHTESSRNKSNSHDAKLTFNYADSTTTIFQAAINGGFSQTPNNYNNIIVDNNTNRYIARQQSDGKNYSPVVDLYFFKQITESQSLTANAVGTYIKTDNWASYDEGAPYEYRVKGKSRSLMSEVIYENRLSKATFSAGANYKQKYIHNEYTGDVSSLNIMHNQRLYAFSDIRGNIGQLRYSAGIGLSHLSYKQDEHKYDFWLWRPKASFAYNFSNEWQISYDFQMYDAVSKIAMISDAQIRTNSMEMTVGSPDLRPSRDYDHTLRISYSGDRLQVFGNLYYKNCHRPNMAHYERTADNKFVYTQYNQKEIDALHTYGYISYWLIEDKLSVATYGGLFRCFNFGDDYTHCYTSYFAVGSLDAYLGNLTLTAYVDNGSRFLEGETKGFNGSNTSVGASYRHKEWSWGVTLSHPFTSSYRVNESEIINRNLHKVTAEYSSDYGNMLSFNVAWRFSSGRRYDRVEKRITQEDRDTGILK